VNAIHGLAGIAAIVLIIELLVVALVVGAIVYFTRRGLIILRQKLIPGLKTAQDYARQAETVTTEASRAIVQPSARVIGTLRGLRRAIATLLQQ
jgi:hypothetical protein